jgi:hypothetical protein
VASWKWSRAVRLAGPGGPAVWLALLDGRGREPRGSLFQRACFASRPLVFLLYIVGSMADGDFIIRDSIPRFP